MLDRDSLNRNNINFIIAVALILTLSFFTIRMGQLLAVSAEQEVEFLKQRYHLVEEFSTIKDN